MKRCFLLAISILCFGNSYAQLDKKTKQFLKEVLPANIAAYQKEIDEADIADINRYFSPDTNLRRNEKGLTYYEMDFDFTKEEKQYIYLEFQKMQGQLWGHDVLPAAKVISKDTVVKVFVMGRRWPYADKANGSRLYSFSKPVFLRRDKIVLFYLGYSCGDLCGQGSLQVYMKKNGSWVPVATISSWIS